MKSYDGWAIVDPHGNTVERTFRFTKREAIADFAELLRYIGNHGWGYWERIGYRAVKVRIVPFEQADNV